MLAILESREVNTFEPLLEDPAARLLIPQIIPSYNDYFKNTGRSVLPLSPYQILKLLPPPSDILDVSSDWEEDEDNFALLSPNRKCEIIARPYMGLSGMRSEISDMYRMMYELRYDYQRKIPKEKVDSASPINNYMCRRAWFSQGQSYVVETPIVDFAAKHDPGLAEARNNYLFFLKKFLTGQTWTTSPDIERALSMFDQIEQSVVPWMFEPSARFEAEYVTHWNNHMLENIRGKFLETFQYQAGELVYDPD